MDLQQKALATFTLVAMVLAFAYFDETLAVFAGIATLPFLFGVLRQ
ncbi:hypothetical protein [Halorubellus litoreus]|uniref:Uncharacterized protein n=1 Tax=Halorubellus litoreus TaxID=755308 RepID=A0ABD5VI97_9EURY